MLTTFTFTTQRQLRAAFWAQHPDASRQQYGPRDAYRCRQYVTDTRVAWCDWLDSLARSGEISERLAYRATL